MLRKLCRRGFKDGVGELVFAQILPDVFGAVEFWCVSGQADQGDVFWNFEFGAAVIACAIEQDDSMRIFGGHLADGLKMLVHGCDIGLRNHNGCRLGGGRTGGSVANFPSAG